jgi:hypothetical protein
MGQADLCSVVFAEFAEFVVPSRADSSGRTSIIFVSSGHEAVAIGELPVRAVSAFQWDKAVRLQIAQSFPRKGKESVDIFITHLE